MYPCPGCGNDRPGLHAACVSCDWKPHETDILKEEPKQGRSIAWAVVCFGVGFGLWFGAIVWLYVVITFMGASPLFVLSGVWQLVTGMGFFVSGWLLTSDAAAARKPLWFSIYALALCFVLGFVLSLSSLRFGGDGADSAMFDIDSPLVACDPDSPKVVSVEFANNDGKEDPMWTATISVDGKKPTQYTEWPSDLAGSQARPVSAKWHNNPDWVEIQLDNGRGLKLTWDENSEAPARTAETMYYLAPKFDRIR